MATLAQPVGIEKANGSVRKPGRLRGWLDLAADQVHFVLTGLMAVALIPALHAAHLPLRFDWAHLLQAWVGLMFQAIFLACALYIVAGGYRNTLRPVLLRYWRDKRRLILLAPLMAELTYLFGAAVAAVVTIAFVAFAELMERTRKQPGALLDAIRSVMLPAVYLFVGLVMVFAYNNVIVSFRFFGAYDAVFNRFDSWILGGATVSGIAHGLGRYLPMGAYSFLEFVYFGMFSQIGAGIILVGLYLGVGKAVRLVGTLLTAYGFALACFYLWPSHGPYYSCPSHFAVFPHQLTAYAAQQTLLARARAVWQGAGISSIGTDYYIAFPCMHIAQPLIVMWFLRRWNRILVALTVVNLVMVAAILILEWHYLVDLMGGVLVATLSVLIVNRDAFSRHSASIPTP
jgi:PAP2 superfamily